MQLRKLGRFEPLLGDRALADELYQGLFAGWGAPAETLEVARRAVHEVLLQLGTPAES